MRVKRILILAAVVLMIAGISLWQTLSVSSDVVELSLAEMEQTWGGHHCPTSATYKQASGKCTEAQEYHDTGGSCSWICWWNTCNNVGRTIEYQSKICYGTSDSQGQCYQRLSANPKYKELKCNCAFLDCVSNWVESDDCASECYDSTM